MATTPPLATFKILGEEYECTRPTLYIWAPKETLQQWA